MSFPSEKLCRRLIYSVKEHTEEEFSPQEIRDYRLQEIVPELQEIIERTVKSELFCFARIQASQRNARTSISENNSFIPYLEERIAQRLDLDEQHKKRFLQRLYREFASAITPSVEYAWARLHAEGNALYIEVDPLPERVEKRNSAKFYREIDLYALPCLNFKVRV